METAQLVAEIMRVETQAELKTLHEAFLLRQDEIKTRLKLQFKKGDKVYFKHPTKGTINGVVTSIGPKNILVTPVNGGTDWRVSPNALYKV